MFHSHEMKIKTVERRLGFPLRGFQQEALEALLNDRDVLVSVPTGLGKTLVYQGASVIFPGITIVVSPLIALLNDQLRRYREAELSVVPMWSEIKGEERQNYLDAIARNEVDTVLTTPETLRSNRALLDALQESGGVSCLAIDEAHAYEDAAYSFRSSYRSLGVILALLNQPRLLLCSATITAHGAAEASVALNRFHWHVILRPATRPNLSYHSFDFPNSGELLAQIVGSQRVEAPGILYTVSARAALKYAEMANRLLGDEEILCYVGKSGGMSEKQRIENQQVWMNGRRWLAATKAFGMGIDKADVRTIVHLELPASLIDYAQESGRAGRDGKPSKCFLSSADSGHVASFLLNEQYPDLQAVKLVWDYLAHECARGEFRPISPSKVESETGIKARSYSVCRGWLDGAGLIDTRVNDQSWYAQFTKTGEDKIPLGKRYDKTREFLKRLKQCKTTAKGFRIDSGLGEKLLSQVYGHPKRKLSQLEKKGVLKISRPDTGKKVRLLSDSFRDFDPSDLERARSLALERLNGVRRFQRLPSSKRSGAIKQAISLEKELISEELERRRVDSEKVEIRVSRGCVSCGARVSLAGGFHYCQECALSKFSS